jgi:hypothetical protein
MYCPRCGQELEHMDRTQSIREQEERAQKRMNDWAEQGCEGPEPDQTVDYSEHYVCWNDECVLRGTSFNLHHPFKGYLSKPGDSWSLAWIK